MFCSPGFSELVKEKAKQDSGDNIPVYVSKPIVIKEKHQAKSVVTLGRGKGFYPYYLKGAHTQCLMEKRGEDLKTPFNFNSNLTNVFEPTVRSINLRDAPHSTTSKWLRVGTKKSTCDVITFTVTLPLSQKSDMKKVVKIIMERYFKYVFGKPRKVNTAGQLALNDAELKLSANSQGPGLYGHLVAVKGNGDPEIAAKTMTDEINAYWSNEIVYTFDCHLDQFMVDYDIKQWVEEHMGANSWDDLSDGCKKICYKNYPKQRLPEWAHILQESY